MESKEYCRLVADALQDKKGNDIKIIDIREISSMGDYFIIADGLNRNQVQAMCDAVEEVLSAAGAKLKNREGYANGGWILLDYYDIIVHIFSEEERNFYDLEHIWRDGIQVQLGDL
ncbi:MAG: ribosome silencing factor [Clostridium sp.]|nr:ribosome silencing factor [Clostridium sp.]MCM1398754.1 ribosome silencing factor [Clostridium sp.]MCM1458614.1 ribosome silencing factor [Bacteroides sp.]